MARVLRWGSGYTGGEDALNLLRDVIDAEEIRLDRWTVVFHPEDKSDDNSKQINSSGKKRQTLKLKLNDEQLKNPGHYDLCVMCALKKLRSKNPKKIIFQYFFNQNLRMR